MKTLISFLFFAVIVLAGCANRQAYPIPSYIAGDEDRSCSALKAEIAQIDADIQARLPDANEGFGDALLALGDIAAFFVEPKNVDKIEVVAFEHRRDRLALIAKAKGCSMPPQK